MQEEDTLLTKLKKIQGISHDEFDSTIELWIDAAKLDLKSIGIVNALVDNPDSLVESAIISYVLSFLDVENSELHSNAYVLQKDKLRHLKEYIEVFDGV